MIWKSSNLSSSSIGEHFCPIHHHPSPSNRHDQTFYSSYSPAPAQQQSFIHHFRICPMREHLRLMNLRNKFFDRNNNRMNNVSKSLNCLLSHSTLSLRSCHHGIHHRTSTPILPSNISERHHHDHSSLSSTALNEILAPNDNQAHIKFQPLITIYDQQAIRTGEFHPSGKYYAIGTNSKLLRIFRYENNTTNNQSSPENKSSDNTPRSIQPNDIHTRNNYHRGSIYCLTWNKLGNLLATGSNDKIVKLLPFNQESGNCPTSEFEMNAHDGTIRDLCFMDDITNGSSLLLSAGAGDCKVYITDCETATPFLSLSGHSAPILSLYTWGGAMFVSGSQDRTIRFWDLRTNSCINFVTCPTISRNKPGGAVAAVCVDPSGKLLVSGHEDSTCMLYDMRGGRVIQTFHPHTADVRTIRFSNKAYYLLTGSYDNRIVLTDLQGDLTQPLQSIPIASHNDKVIQCRWNPNEFTFISTSADKSAIIWQLPPDDDYEQP